MDRLLCSDEIHSLVTEGELSLIGLGLWSFIYLQAKPSKKGKHRFRCNSKMLAARFPKVKQRKIQTELRHLKKLFVLEATQVKGTLFDFYVEKTQMSSFEAPSLQKEAFEMSSFEAPSLQKEAFEMSSFEVSLSQESLEVSSSQEKPEVSLSQESLEVSSPQEKPEVSLPQESLEVSSSQEKPEVLVKRSFEEPKRKKSSASPSRREHSGSSRREFLRSSKRKSSVYQQNEQSRQTNFRGFFSVKKPFSNQRVVKRNYLDKVKSWEHSREHQEKRTPGFSEFQSLKKLSKWNERANPAPYVNQEQIIPVIRKDEPEVINPVMAEAPTIYESEAPIIYESEAPIIYESEAPIIYESEAPVGYESQNEEHVVYESQNEEHVAFEEEKYVVHRGEERVVYEEEEIEQSLLPEQSFESVDAVEEVEAMKDTDQPPLVPKSILCVNEPPADWLALFYHHNMDLGILNIYEWNHVMSVCRQFSVSEVTDAFVSVLIKYPEPFELIINSFIMNERGECFPRYQGAVTPETFERKKDERNVREARMLGTYIEEADRASPDDKPRFDLSQKGLKTFKEVNQLLNAGDFLGLKKYF